MSSSGKQRIDLLKLDIEGAEEQLFSSNYSNWIGRIKNMMIEAHSQQALDAVLSTTKNHGFIVTEDGAHIVCTRA